MSFFWKLLLAVLGLILLPVVILACVCLVLLAAALLAQRFQDGRDEDDPLNGGIER